MKKYFFLILFLKASVLPAVSISELTSYPDFCFKAANNEAIFSNFKRSPRYQSILEHVSYNDGCKYLEIIDEKFPFILKYLGLCRENDQLGNPITFNFGHPFGRLSPTTARYMKVAGDLIELFGDLKDKKIIEIGGGYGGQCKILSVLSGFSYYTIVDLPEASLLAAKYLRLLNVDQVSVESNQSFVPSDEYDLLISNYAFSEVSRDEQIIYIENILNRSKCGYMTYNFIHEFPEQSLSLTELLELISIPGRDIQILPEIPLTSPKNMIITWSSIK